MKAIETNATIVDRSQLHLDRPLDLAENSRVRVIVLVSEPDDSEPDDTPDEIVLEGLRQDLQGAIAEQTLPLQMWEGIDAQ